MPDFVLVTSEIICSVQPHDCTILSQAPIGLRDDAYLVHVEPPLPIAGDREVAEIIVAPRWEGTSIRPVNPPPAAVNVISPMNAVHRSERLVRGYEILDWGLVFESPDVAWKWRAYWEPRV